jgi:hypothetical protein
VVKFVFSVIGILLLIATVTPFVKAAFLPAHVADKAVDTAYEVADKTLNGDNVIANYEWFKQQSHDYEAIQAKIRQADADMAGFEKSAGPRDKWGFDDRQERSRLGAIVTGLKAQAEDIRSAYNARSKMANRSIFKTHDLPESL